MQKVTFNVALSADAGLPCGDFLGLSMFLDCAQRTGEPTLTGAAGDTSLE